MEEEALRGILSERLITLRKAAGYTQAEIGEKLNYSDKSVSKWERGEGLPDLYVLYKLSKLYGVSIDSMIGQADVISDAEAKPNENAQRRRLTFAAAFCAVWLIAVVSFALLSILRPDASNAWLAFVYAIPACSTVCGALLAHWRARFLWPYCLFSLALWGGTLCLYLSVPMARAYLLFVVMAAIQLSSVVIIAIWLKSGIKH